MATHAIAHDLGGDNHNADTLANLNGKISDATLDDSGDPRDPNAHAASHQNGGTDEVATATPAANAIPKADGSGKLNSWVDTASPGGASNNVQYNSGGAFAGDSTFNFFGAGNLVLSSGGFTFQTVDTIYAAYAAQGTDSVGMCDGSFALNVAGVSNLEQVDLAGGFALRFQNLTNYLSLQATPSASYTITLPAAAPGAANKVLESDGSGNLSWIDTPGGGTPGGADTQVQFNDSGAFGANAGLTYDSTLQILKVGNEVWAADLHDSGGTEKLDLGTAGKVVVSSGQDLRVDLIENTAGTSMLNLASHQVVGGDGVIAMQLGGSTRQLVVGGSGRLDWANRTLNGAWSCDTSLQVDTLNTGDNVITTDTSGLLQESGVKVETAPTGGSGFAVVEYATAPTSPPAGFLWIEAKDASTKTLNFYDGSTTYSVDLAA